MKINYISYQLGTDEARLLAKLLRQHINVLETAHSASIGTQMPAAALYEYSMTTDMYNDILKLL